LPGVDLKRNGIQIGIHFFLIAKINLQNLTIQYNIVCKNPREKSNFAKKITTLNSIKYK